MANTDERLRAIVEQAGELITTKTFLRDYAARDYVISAAAEAPFAAQKAIEARDALRRIRDVCEPETPFTRAVSKPVLKAMVELIDGILED